MPVFDPHQSPFLSSKKGNVTLLLDRLKDFRIFEQQKLCSSFFEATILQPVKYQADQLSMNETR